MTEKIDRKNRQKLQITIPQLPNEYLYHLLGHLLLALLLRLLGVAEVVSLDEVDKATRGVDGEFARRQLEGLDLLVEDGAELLERQDAQRVDGDGDDALGTLLGGEAAGVLEALVGEGREVEAALVHVAEPGAAGQRQHGLGALHSDLEEFDWPRAQVPVAIGLEFRVGYMACFF